MNNLPANNSSPAEGTSISVYAKSKHFGELAVHVFLIIVLCVAALYFDINKPKSGDFWQYTLYICIPVFILILFASSRRRVIANAHGIRWRFWFAWRKASWDSVSDFYYDYSYKHRRNCVVTDQGKIFFDDEITNGEELKNLILERTSASGAAPREWQDIAWRVASDSSASFDYTRLPKDQRDMLIILMVSFVALMGIAVSNDHERLFQSESASEAFYELFPMLMLIIIIAPIIFVVGVLVLQSLRRRGNQEYIQTSEEGIVFRDRSGQRFYLWSAVKSIQIRSAESRLQIYPRYVVNTTSVPFDFSTGISNYKKLVRQIAEHTDAFRLGEDVWRMVIDQDSYLAAGPGPDSRGTNTHFHFRINMIRAMLLGLTAITVLVWFKLAMSFWNDGFRNMPVEVGMGILLAALTAAAWSGYWRYGYTLTPSGLIARTLFQNKHIRWSDISDYYIDAEGRMILQTQAKKHKIRVLISNLPQFLEEVQVRATNAGAKVWVRRNR